MFWFFSFDHIVVILLWLHYLLVFWFEFAYSGITVLWYSLDLVYGYYCQLGVSGTYREALGVSWNRDLVIILDFAQLSFWISMRVYKRDMLFLSVGMKFFSWLRIGMKFFSWLGSIVARSSTWCQIPDKSFPFYFSSNVVSLSTKKVTALSVILCW